jgi:hypothetical protein
MFLNGLNDDIQFQHIVDKAIVTENKIKEMEMEKDGKRKVSFNGQPSRSNVRPHFSQPTQFFKPPQMNQSQMPMQVSCPQFQIQQPNFQAQHPSF